MTVKTGIEVLRDNGYKILDGKRVGLMTNPSAVDRILDSTYEILLNEPLVNLVALFAPEHGLFGSVPAGELFASQTDPISGLPVHSLYGDTLKPTREMLDNVDVIVCDIQDIGVRYYTYTWTISHILESAGEFGTEVIILDRPNPLGGIRIEGPLLDVHFATLVGRFPVPVVHGMTLGEVLRLVNETWNPNPARYSVIPCEGWQRDMTWGQTDLPWIVPSPNMPHLSTLYQYPGSCLIEGVNLSEGRGTTLPFEIAGAPWIDSWKLAHYLNAQQWAEASGVRFRSHSFQPSSSKFAGQTCHGIQVHITNFALWKPIPVWLHVIATIRVMYPENFEWIPPFREIFHFDRLIGSDKIRLGLEAGHSLDELMADWEDSCAAFSQQREPFLFINDYTKVYSCNEV